MSTVVTRKCSNLWIPLLQWLAICRHVVSTFACFFLHPLSLPNLVSFLSDFRRRCRHVGCCGTFSGWKENGFRQSGRSFSPSITVVTNVNVADLNRSSRHHVRVRGSSPSLFLASPKTKPAIKCLHVVLYLPTSLEAEETRLDRDVGNLNLR